MWKLKVDKEARKIAIKYNQVVDLKTKEVGGEGDYFVTLEQLLYILLSIKE